MEIKVEDRLANKKLWGSVVCKVHHARGRIAFTPKRAIGF